MKSNIKYKKTKSKKHADKREIKYISFKSFLAMYDITTNLRNRLILKLLFFGLFRRQELSSVKIEDINFEDYEIILHKENTKTDDARVITLDQSIMTEIKTYLNTVKRKKGYLFGTRQSRHISPEMINLIVKQAAKKANIQSTYGKTKECPTGKSIKRKNKGKLMKRQLNQITAHTLRHSGIINMKNRGINDSTIMLQSGHACFDSFRIYAKYSTKDRQKQLQSHGAFDME